MPTKQSRTRLAKIAAAALFSAVAVSALLFLGLEVLRKLGDLESAQSDNIQWTLAQAEVEFLELEVALENALHTPPEDLRGIRREFDVFYSRMQTLREGEIFATLRLDADALAALERVTEFLDYGVSVVDSPDAQLRAALPEFAARARNLHEHVRAFSVAGLYHFAKDSDQQRASVFDTLLWLALTSALLLALSLLAAMIMRRMYRQSEGRADDLLLASNRMATIVSTSLDAIVVADRDGRIVEFSDAAETIFGHNREDVIGRELGNVIVPEQYRQAHEAGMERYRETGEKRVAGAGRVQLEALHADGTVFPIEMAIQSAKGHNEDLFVAFVRDISHRLKAEQELIEARDQAVAGEKAKTEFLAMMSHEIRTPLNGILGTLSLLRDTRLSGKQIGYVENMETSGALLLNQVNDVLDVTKYDAGKLELVTEPVDLGALAQNIVDSQRDLASASGNTLVWDWVGAPLGPVLADPVRLTQVLVNLVGNAVKFTENGRISLEFEVESRSMDRAELAIRVIDTGLGMEPEVLDRIFRDFETGDASYTRQTGGTGLGLGISRRLVEAMGGQIGAESTPGEGSVFWLLLPLELTSEVPVAPDHTTTDQPVSTVARALNVLIVEDNEINRIVLTEMLSGDGHRVTQANDGRAGLQAAQAERFDVILMDISMPVMDGMEATRAIRTGNGPSHDAPIYAVTAHALPSEIAEFRKHGMTGHLAKPVDRVKLRAIAAGVSSGSHLRPSNIGKSAASQWADLEDDLGAATLATLLDRFASEGDEIVAYVTQISHADWTAQEAAAQCHKLAGSAAVLRFDALREALIDAERVLKSQGDSAEAKAALAALGGKWTEVKKALPDP